MPDKLCIETYKADLGRIAHDIFETMLGVEIQTAGQDRQPTRDHLTGAVYLAGAWTGALLLECDRAQAYHFTNLLMGIPKPEEVNDDVKDAIGELANMLGGNLKSVLPHGVVLSMPSVVEGGDYSLSVCGRNVMIDREAYLSSAGAFWITLVELKGTY